MYKSGKHRNKKLKELEIYLSAFENKAVKIIDKMEHFSFAEFLVQFSDKPQNKSSVIDALNERHKKLSDSKRISTALTYQYTIKSIEDYLKFIKRKKLTFCDITPELLQSFEDWMTANDKSITTTGIFLRNLRTILNQAIEDGLLPRENYSFSKNKYQIPSARNIKKALTIENIKKFHVCSFHVCSFVVCIPAKGVNPGITIIQANSQLGTKFGFCPLFSFWNWTYMWLIDIHDSVGTTIAVFTVHLLLLFIHGVNNPY